MENGWKLCNFTAMVGSMGHLSLPSMASASVFIHCDNEVCNRGGVALLFKPESEWGHSEWAYHSLRWCHRVIRPLTDGCFCSALAYDYPLCFCRLPKTLFRLGKVCRELGQRGRHLYSCEAQRKVTGQKWMLILTWGTHMKLYRLIVKKFRT